MQYLKASSCESEPSEQYPKICGVNNESYVRHCLTIDGHSLDYHTLYEYEHIQHPTTGEYALCIDKLDYLATELQPLLIDHATMESEGWFVGEEVI